VEAVGEDLDDDLHQVLLGQRVLAAHDLLKDRWENLLLTINEKISILKETKKRKEKKKKKRTNGLVDVKVNAVKLAEANEVGADKDLELTALTLPPLAVLGVALMLHPHPELVHLDEVGQHERECCPPH